MSSSNCCFLTCIQVSQETGQVVWYFHLFKNFPLAILLPIFLYIPIMEYYAAVKKRISNYIYMERLSMMYGWYCEHTHVLIYAQKSLGDYIPLGDFPFYYVYCLLFSPTSKHYFYVSCFRINKQKHSFLHTDRESQVKEKVSVLPYLVSNLARICNLLLPDISCWVA